LAKFFLRRGAENLRFIIRQIQFWQIENSFDKGDASDCWAKEICEEKLLNLIKEVCSFEAKIT
jgi:hypothetical protein